jgi:hypothetical protein
MLKCQKTYKVLFFTVSPVNIQAYLLHVIKAYGDMAVKVHKVLTSEMYRAEQLMFLQIKINWLRKNSFITVKFVQMAQTVRMTVECN